MDHIQELLANAKAARKSAEEYYKMAQTKCDSEKIYLNAYRIESVNRVLDFVKSEYSAGRICDLEILLTHCQSKLNGNIDGTELSLAEPYKGIPFRKVDDEDEDTRSTNA